MESGTLQGIFKKMPGSTKFSNLFVVLCMKVHAQSLGLLVNLGTIRFSALAKASQVCRKLDGCLHHKARVIR